MISFSTSSIDVEVVPLVDVEVVLSIDVEVVPSVDVEVVPSVDIEVLPYVETHKKKEKMVEYLLGGRVADEQIVFV